MLSIHFSPGTLAFKLETETLTTNEYKVIFKVKNSFGDVFAVTPFSIIYISIINIFQVDRLPTHSLDP